MTSKEKAKELFDLMYSNQLNSVKFNTPILAMELSKQCALIAVEEIIATFIPKNNKSYLCEEIEFWQEVKIEIENL